MGREAAEICHLMNDTFHEEVSPVVHRTHAGINVFIGLNVMRFVDDNENIKWNTKPGSTPQVKHSSNRYNLMQILKFVKVINLEVQSAPKPNANRHHLFGQKYSFFCVMKNV